MPEASPKFVLSGAISAISQATQTGMTNGWLKQQELLSICQLWIKVQGYAQVISVVGAS